MTEPTIYFIFKLLRKQETLGHIQLFLLFGEHLISFVLIIFVIFFFFYCVLVGTGFCKVKKMFDVELFVFGPLVISALRFWSLWGNISALSFLCFRHTCFGARTQYRFCNLKVINVKYEYLAIHKGNINWH